MSGQRVFPRRRRRFRLPMRIVAPLLAALTLVMPLRMISTPLAVERTAAQSIEICGVNPSPDYIVQDCDLRDAGFRELEQQTINDLLAVHGLPASDYSKLIEWEPDAIRAAMFASIVTMILKDPAQRTPTEQSIVDAMTERVHARRVAAAQFSLTQYNHWKLDPCYYEPPPGFTYDGLARCSTPIGGVFVPPRPPSLEEFLAYGNAHIYADFMDGGIAQAAAADAARMLGLVFGLVAAAGAAAIGAVVGASLTVSSALIAAIHPFLAAAVAGSNSAVAIAAVAGASAGGVGAASIAALVGIIVAALVIAIIQFITVFTDEAIPGQLQDNLNAAINTPIDLAQLLQTKEGKTEIFATFLLETMPDFSHTVSAPPPGPSFIITEPGGATSRSQTLEFVCWHPVDCGADALQSARLSGGWFVAQSASDPNGPERMALGIDYLNWGAQAWTAWRIGPTEFLHTRTGDDSEPFVSNEIRYLEFNGTAMMPLIAVVNGPPSAPGAPIASSAVNNGVFNLTWDASTDPEGDAVTYTLQRVKPPECQDFCSETLETIASGLTTNQYAFTSSAPEGPGNWTYRVTATDGDVATPGATSAPVLVDNRPPLIFFKSRTEANEHGWNNGDVTVTWVCFDTNEDNPATGPGGIPIIVIDPDGPPVSGVVAESVDQSVTGEGVDQSVTGTCEDHAGNRAEHTVSGINIDTTPPTASFEGPYTAEEGSTVELNGTPSSDSLSGIASTSWSVDQDDVFDDGDPAYFTPLDGPAVYEVKLRAVDKAGNEAIASTTVTSTNALPTVYAPDILPDPSEEGEFVEASAAFSDAGMDDAHRCEIDWGDGTTAIGTIAGMVCSGGHVYADDDPSGTAADVYTITFTVQDTDGGIGQASVIHTVNNVAPTITGINFDGSIPQGSSVTMSVEAIDVAGALDPLSYAFDCDNDGYYETAGSGSQGTCALDPARAVSTIGVRVSDDDLGVTIDKVNVSQTVTLCANRYTGALGAPLASGQCPSVSTTLTMPGASGETLCIQRYTGELNWAPRGNCSPVHAVHVVPDDGPLAFCQNRYTGNLRYTPSGACSPVERAGVIPGTLEDGS